MGNNRRAAVDFINAGFSDGDLFLLFQHKELAVGAAAEDAVASSQQVLNLLALAGRIERALFIEAGDNGG